MSYATQADMVDRFGETEMVEATAHADPETTVIVAAPMNAALADADSLINSYLAARYTVPLTEVPRVVVNLACTIARYLLWQVGAAERVRKDYEDAIQLLKDVSTGKASLGIAAPQEADAQAATVGGVLVSAPPRIFTRESLRDF